MTTATDPPFAAAYASVLTGYLEGEQEGLANAAVRLAESCLAQDLGPMDIKAFHDVAIGELVNPEDALVLVNAHKVLLEVLFAYGAAYSAVSERLLAEADEAARAHSEGAERAEQARLALLAGVSHELGNPLMVVKVNVASIRKLLEERGGWPEDLSERQADIQFAVDRMLSLREELLAASRNEQRELNIVPMPLIHILRRVVRWARTSATEKSIELTEDYESKLPYVLADDGALQSVFTNLLSNAIRYTNSEGRVTVRAVAEGSQVIVTVEDTGIGISEEDQLRIFERFYRTEAAKRHVNFGVGLGLAITRDLVTSLAGTITLSSETGRGSAFSVSLPIADEVSLGAT